MTIINHYTDTKKAKQILAHYIELPLLSVRRERKKLVIKVKGNAGTYQAWSARKELRKLGLDVFPYGHVDDIAAGNPSSVRITIGYADED